MRGSCPGGTSLIRVFSVSTGFRQDAQPNDGGRWHRRHRHGVQPGQLRQRLPL
jgi:hypothetical protein